MFVMKIPKSDYPLIATMFRLGLRTKDIATRYGVNADYLSSIKSKILGEDSVGEVTDIRDFSKVRLVELAMRGHKDDTVKLNAVKALADIGDTVVGDERTTKDTAKVKLEILSELSSQ